MTGEGVSLSSGGGGGVPPSPTYNLADPLLRNTDLHRHPVLISVNTCEIPVMRIANTKQYSTKRLLVIEIPRARVIWAFNVDVFPINTPSAVGEVPQALHVGCNLKLRS